MKRVVKLLAVILVLAVVLFAAGALWLNRHVQSPAFKQTVLSAARDALGTEVKINDMNVSLLSGVTLRGVAIANAGGFPGDLLTADAFVLRYRLLPLLRKQVEIEEVSVSKPKITLVSNASGAWNYEAFGGTAPAGKAGSSPAPSTPSSSPLDITLSRLAMDDGEVAMLDETGKALVRIQNADLTSSLQLTGNAVTGSGVANIETINVADQLFARQLSSPVTISTDEVKLAPLSGKLAGGDVTGDITMKLTGGAKFIVNLQLKDGDMDKLLQEAGTKPVMNGKLQLTTGLEGTGGLPTITGNGRAEIIGGTLVQVPLQNLLATLLQLPDLREIKFDECRLEFTMANNVMQTPVISLKSPQVQVTGSGSVKLDDYSLDHKLTLALSKDVVARIPVKEIRSVFAERADGFQTLDFKVWGPYDSPKTDLTDRLLRGATQQLIDKGLQKLFKQ